MSPTFDLLQSPWIPCIQNDGTFVELGLRDALVRAHELRELSGESPLVTAALYRLLLAVLHRALQGPADADEWADLWNAGRWDAAQLDAYLERWQHRFDLFHPERPFYQAPDERVKPKSVTSLILDIASGNNRTLFDHHTDSDGISLTPAQAARMLVTAQNFGLSGRCAPGLPNFTYGSGVKGVLFFVQGDTLFETLALNLLPYPDDTILIHHPEDRPAWEMDDPFTPDRTRPHGYLDYLTWQNRRILLLPEETGSGIVIRQMTMAPGLILDKVLDPAKHYSQNAKLGFQALRLKEARALWRDSAALFQLHNPGVRPPRVFRWLAELVVDEGYLDESQTYHYLAFGIAIGKKAADVDFYRSEQMPLPLSYLKERALVDALRTALNMAEKARNQLWGATRTLATFLLSPEADTEGRHQPAREDLDSLTQQWAVERRYWSRLELPFRRTMEALPQGVNKALVIWRKTLWRTAWEAFDQVADNLGHDPRTLKAVVRARGQLAAGLSKALPSSDTNANP